MKLSEAQRRFLTRCFDAGRRGYETPFTGNLSAWWYRTGECLARRGLVVLRDRGDRWVAYLPELAPEKEVQR